MSQVPKKYYSGFGLFLFVAVLFLSFSFFGCGGSSAGEDDDGNNDNGDDDDNNNNNSSACTSITAPNWDHPWPMFHGFENHQGLSDAAGPQDTNSVWTFNANPTNTQGKQPNSIAIAEDGTIYVAGGNAVYSVDPDTHDANWSKTYADAQGPALSADGNTLYFGSQQSSSDPDSAGQIVAVNTSDGSENWTYQVDGAVHFGPTVGPDGTVYQGSWDMYLYAINPDDGSLKWRYLTNGAVSYPPSILNCADSSIDDIVILGAGDAHEGDDCNIYAVDAETGEKVWTFDTQTTTLNTDSDSNPTCESDTPPFRTGTPSISDDALIYAPAGPTLFVLDSEGALQWQLGTSSTENFGIISPAIASDGTIYQTNSGGPDAAQIYALDPATEDVKSGWPYEVTEGDDNGIPSFPVVDSEGTVYFGDVANQSIYAVDKDGNELFSYATGDHIAEASPALVDGVLYISSDDGLLYVIGP